MNIQNADGLSAPYDIQTRDFAGLHDPQRLGSKAMFIDRDRIPAHDPFGGQPQQPAVHMPPQIPVGNDADKDAFLHNADTAEPFACHDAEDFRHRTVEGR